MPEYSLAAYTIRVRPRMSSKSSDNYLPLDNFDGSASDLAPFLYAFFNGLINTPYQHRDEGKYLIAETVRAEDRSIHTTVRSGSHGHQSTLRDVETHQDTYERQANEAELIPLRNLFVIPHNSLAGIFLTERVGVRGLKSSLDHILTRTFSARFPGFSIELSPLAPEAAVKASIEEGELKKIRLVRYGIPSDVADQYNLGAHEEELGIMELVLKPDRALAFPKQKVRDALNDNSLPALLEIRGLDYHDIKLEVKVGKSMRTLTVTQERPPRVTFPLPENKQIPSGRPTDDVVYEVAAEVVAELAKDLSIRESDYVGTEFFWTADILAGKLVIANDEG
ncbi:hypothetical protein [Micromonospora sp. LHW51205]|uniref:hypothetical protein n=1 Tax=Micromonospora sp. LHW51205 TaxID=2248752 RepID=UPI0011BE7365|nr:hypothetical protein [Micromonospora sp. LHW51205]